MDTLQQAVILAGGLGTRLQHLTHDCPKPMVEVAGKPFLAHLLAQLQREGITQVILLLGYLAEKIQAYVGDGSRWGLDIQCVVTPVEYDTGLRLKSALPFLQPCFMLMYCDNYWPLNRTLLWQSFQQKSTLAQIVVYRNTDQYTRSNVRLSADLSQVLSYDKSRQDSSLQGVDIGYALLQRELVAQLSDANIPFESQLYPALAASQQLTAYPTEHRYYGIGSLDRLNDAQRFFSSKRVVFLDRDGVLNAKAARWDYIKTWEEFEWLPGSIQAIEQLKQSGYLLILVSNQAGIARGIMTQEQLNRIHDKMQELLQQTIGYRLDAIYYCSHGWDEGCYCRKPNPGMLFQAQKDFALDLTKCYMIGDSQADHDAATKAGCLPLMVEPEHSLLDLVKANF